ncbi:MAG: hypothetical protein J6Q67_06795 [Clostridia bacterium]|nr:hypothetical protein [Clostridia bacterium]
MDYSSMRLFLSEENIKMHLEYLNKQKLVYSILQKSYPKLTNDIKMVYQQNLPREIKKEALTLLCDIKSHEMFFNSFINTPPKCKNIKKFYSSEERLIYEVYLLAKNNKHGFIYICLDKNAAPIIQYRSEPSDIFIRYEPVLAFDLCEHTYFKDYGFNRERFLGNSLGHLNLKLLDDRLISIDN